MARPIFPSNDFNVGVGPLRDENDALATGLNITAWLSDEENHSAGNPAPAIDPELSVDLAESTPDVSGDYPGFIPAAAIDEHLIDVEPDAVRHHVWLHRADSTGSWTHPPERCRIYPRRLL